MAKGDEILERRQEVSQLLLAGYEYAAIADNLGVSVSVVASDVAEIRRGWIEQSRSIYEEALGAELQRIQWVENEARRAWDESKKSFRRTVTGDGASSETVETRTGDARYLRAVQWAIETRIKLFDLERSNQNLGKDGIDQSRVIIVIPDNGRDPASTVALPERGLVDLVASK